MQTQCFQTAGQSNFFYDNKMIPVSDIDQIPKSISDHWKENALLFYQFSDNKFINTYALQMIGGVIATVIFWSARVVS